MSDLRRPDARPLYAQVEAILNERIVSGTWTSGQALPAEPELAHELGVSPGTLRRALAGLERRHLIERRQGRGTYVARHTSRAALGQFFRVRTLDGRAAEPESLITRVATGPATPEEAARLRLEPGAEVHRVDRSRRLDGTPRIVERITLPAALFMGLSLPLAPEQLEAEIYVHYQSAHGITVVRSEELLSAAAATEEDAAILGLPVGAPLLVIDRVTFDAARRPVEMRVTRLDTRAHRYAIELT